MYNLLHKKGYTYPTIINLLLKCQGMGFTLILFTGNEGDKLDVIIKQCKDLGLNIEYANESRTATWKECKDLFFELIDIGYDLICIDKEGNEIGDSYGIE